MKDQNQSHIQWQGSYASKARSWILFFCCLMYILEKFKIIFQVQYHLRFLDCQAICLSSWSWLLIHFNLSTVLVWVPVPLGTLLSILRWVIDYYVYVVLLYEGERREKVISLSPWSIALSLVVILRGIFYCIESTICFTENVNLL